MFDHYVRTTHNDPLKHLLGIHGPKQRTDNLNEAELLTARAAAGEYVDVHAWIFSPRSFRSVMEEVAPRAELNVENVGRTMVGRREFFAVLRKVGVGERQIQNTQL